MSTEPMMRDYQAEAVEAITEALAEGGRAQLHAACGSGKSLIGVWSGDRLVPGDGLIVVAAPTLALVGQLIDTWRDHASLDAVLAVCSDDSVTDAPVHLDDIDAQATTDPAPIGAWLTGSGRRLIVTTYLSAKYVGEALRATGSRADLAIFDEAHHLAGRPEHVTRQILDDKVFPAARRLYMTATPRIDAVRADTSGALSMDDEDVFGPIAYAYPWARAIQDGHLEDYRIAVAGVSEREFYTMLRDEDRLYTEDASHPDLRTLAAQAVIAKAARRFGLRRILAFCPRIDAAKIFTASFETALASLPASERPEGGLYASTVTGDMTIAQREVVLDRLRTPPEQWSVVANVRCLSEGVDVPAVDAVAFVHPKRSQVDIIQAVGRALRRSPEGSGTATIIVPIVIPDSETEVGDLDPGDFRVLWQVVRALRSHDEALGIELDIQRSHESTVGIELPARVTVDLPEGTSERFARDLTALLVKQATSEWWVGYGHARAWFDQHGHLQVPTSAEVDGFALGNWVRNARQHYRKGWLRPDRIKALEKIGMVWDTKAVPWMRLVEEISAFKARHGHTLVPQSYVTDQGYPLGIRVNQARRGHARIPSGIRAQLDDLGMVWDTRDLRWQRMYTALLDYQSEYGHLRIPVSYRTSDGYGLGAALKGVWKRWRAGTLDPAEQASLEELGLRPPESDQAWKDFLAATDRYVTSHGDLAVPKGYVDAEGYRLGSAISYYRNLNNGTKRGADGTVQRLDPDRRAALDARGMIWRLAPARDLTEAEADRLKGLSGTDLAAAIVDLVDAESVTQSSIAEALGLARSYLNTKLKNYRETGRWPDRGRYRKASSDKTEMDQ